MFKTSVCPALALAAALVGAAPLRSSSVSAAPAATAPAHLVPAPAWQLKDIYGHTISSADFKGRVLVVDFWATWCPPCRSEIPGYVHLQQKYRQDGLAIVGVSLDQDGATEDGPAALHVRRFVQEHGVAYTIVLADDQVAGSFGMASEIPTTYIIDRNGNIRYQKVGAIPTADFEQILLPILHEQPDLATPSAPPPPLAKS